MQLESLEDSLRTYLEEGIFYKSGGDISPHSHGAGQINPGIGVAETPGIPALTDKIIPYYKDGNLTEDTLFTWDEITTRLGIGINSPTRELHVHSTGTLSRIKITNTTSGSGTNDGGEIKLNGVILSIFNQESGGVHLHSGGSSSVGIFIDQSNRVAIGHIVPSTDTNLHIKLGAGGAGTGMFLETVSELIANSTTIEFRKARGSTGTEATVTAGYLIGKLEFNGHNGTDFETGAKIQVEARETHSVTARGTSVHFYTTPNTTTTLLERLVIKEDGNVGIGITPTAKLHVDQFSTSAAIPVLTLDQADVSEEMIEFVTTIGTGNAIEAIAAKTLTTTHFIKVTLPGGLTRYIPCGTIA